MQILLYGFWNFKGKKKPTSFWKHVIDEYIRLGLGAKVNISGGEPLIRKDCVDIGMYAKSLGCTTRLLTNGSRLHLFENKLKSAFDTIQVTLDGATKSVHEGYRGNGSFEEVTRAFRLLKKLNIPRTMAINVFPENIDDLHENLSGYIEYLDDYELSINLSYDIIPWGRSLDASYKGYEVDAIATKMGDLLEKIEKQGIPKIETYVMNKKLRNCGIGSTIAVDSKGIVSPCAIPYLKIGKIQDPHSVEEIFNKVAKMREEVSFEGLDCNECDLKYICLGGCRASHKVKYGDFNTTGCTEKHRLKKYRHMVNSIPIRMVN